MKQAAALGAIGLLALIIQGALARVLAPPLCPDLGFLVVLGIGSCWRGLTSGLVLAAALFSLGIAMFVWNFIQYGLPSDEAVVGTSR